VVRSNGPGRLDRRRRKWIRSGSHDAPIDQGGDIGGGVAEVLQDLWRVLAEARDSQQFGVTVSAPMERGATQDEDVTFLFITNKEFGIHYVGDANDPDAPVAAS
jgi:hypothetical protein